MATKEESLIGLDLAGFLVQADGAATDGSEALRRKLSRGLALKALEGRPTCLLAVEICASAHHRERVIDDPGHEFRLIPPADVTLLATRRKNDTAETIAEAVVPGHAVCRGRARGAAGRGDGLSHPGSAAPAAHADGPVHRGRAWPGTASSLPPAEPCRRARANATMRQLVTTPGAGPIPAAAIAIFAPPMERVHEGRDVAARVALTPSQHSSGGKERLDRKDTRRRPIIGAVAVVR